ncbi:bifunctional uroporphyrinogen-III C-methyltransferase/uroporphyrinogen-III synthase [Glycomyces xiaoerkulensis]|uniref:uroporphyrinogen-III synthase n=1 Tax=Glycomyces xiaoerkulensis TaxID=2038139 RepID=UPI000C256724|nr:uroporphyrinogen-III synthase [Glycomyces xiaoerkulensis]
MTGARKLVGRVRFVGTGPGDPGLLTKRALDAITEADRVYYDRSMPQSLLEAAKELTGDEGRLRLIESSPGDQGKLMAAAARDGENIARLLVGDAYPNRLAKAEIRAAGAEGARFEVIPGMSHAQAVGVYAGMPPGEIRTVIDIDDIASLEPQALADAVKRGSLTVTADVSDLSSLRDILLAGGVLGETPVAVTGDATGETEYTTTSSVDTFVEAALGYAGQVVLTIGPGVDERADLAWWESRPLYGWKVLIPRTKEQAGVMSERLRAYGAIPCEVPTIAVEPPRTPAQMERSIKGLVDGRYAWIVFTSQNSVRAIWEKFKEHGLDARAFGGIKIACIGEATADKVRAFGVEPELLPSGQQSSEGLLEVFPPHDPVLDMVGRVLLPRADIATETLVQGLSERGWEVDDVTAYRTVRASPPAAEIRDAIKSGGFDAVLFTSSSTVRNLVGIAGKPHQRTVVATIGPATADTASEFGLRVDAKPELASVPDLIESLAEYAVELRKRLAEGPIKTRRGQKVQGPTALRFR